MLRPGVSGDAVRPRYRVREDRVAVVVEVRDIKVLVRHLLALLKR